MVLIGDLKMGRIKTKMIKRVTTEVFEKHKDLFSEDFEQNKQKVSEVAEIGSKKLRNVIAGYVTRLAKNKETI